MGCKRGMLPTSYLGLPLGVKYKSKMVWDGVEEKFRRLAMWKRSQISKGGRLYLLKSTLSYMPTYLVSLFSIPKSVASWLEKMQRSSCGEEVQLKRKCTRLHGTSVVRRRKKEEGGLEIRKLNVFNQALAKWSWKFANEGVKTGKL